MARPSYDEVDVPGGSTGRAGAGWTKAEVIPCGIPRRFYGLRTTS